MGYRRPSIKLRTIATRPHGVGISDIGVKRSSNQDAFYASDALGLYAVADGMGGLPAGDVASREAIDAMFGMVKQGRSQLCDLRSPLVDGDARAACRLLESAVQAATYQVFAMAVLDPTKTGMGTTLSVLLFLGGYAAMAHVGDSRIYRVRNNVVQAITEDHTYIAWQLKQGLIKPQQAKTSAHVGMLARAVGTKDHVDVDTGLVTVASGDHFLLCTDGLHNYVRDADISFSILLGNALAAQRLVDLAKERGGSDNITAVIVECD